MRPLATLLFIAFLGASFAYAEPAPATGLIASFETDTDHPFVLRETVTATRVTDYATHGKYSWRVVSKGSEQPSWPCLFLYAKDQPDWSARQTLVMDIFLETPDPVEFGAQLCTKDNPGKATTQSLGKLRPGWNKGLTLVLPDFGWDLHQVDNLALYLGSPKKDVIYYLDNVRWEAVSAQGGENGWLNVRDFGASGSEFETTATTTAGSRQITVADVGDLQPGQAITVSRCNIRYLRQALWGPTEPYGSHKELGDAVELRGYDGSGGSWLTFLLEVDGGDPVTFRWKSDLAKPWVAGKVPVTYDWQKLSGGVEVKFKRQEWKPGHMVTFAARDQLTTTIEKIDGKVLTLSDAANRAATDAVVRHTDREAIQRTITTALRRKCNVFFPAGRYRIPGGLSVVNPSGIRLEGAAAATTILDISDGEGSCFALSRGTEATIRNFTMIGHTGLEEAPQSFTTSSGYGFWPNTLKGCNAVGMSGTERILIENVHASRMANEAFYAQGPYRTRAAEPTKGQKELTYLRCSVTDCAANAFNNNDAAENTSVLYCRVDGAGWHACEMPARFLRVSGCYFRNTGPITVGDMSHRGEGLNELGCGQAIITDNVFEGIGRCGGIGVNHGSSQVVISGNLFINYNGTAITVSSHTVRPPAGSSAKIENDFGSYPSRSAVVTGNIIDLTYEGEKPASRIGIDVDASEVTIADNQIYVRGTADPRVTGLRLREPALYLDVHNNLLRNCGTGLLTGRARSSVSQVFEDGSFRESALPLEWRYSHQYQGWNAVWVSGSLITGTSVIEAYDPGTLRFKLKTPRAVKVGDSFEVYPTEGANWNLHDNTITGCLKPVILDTYGGSTNQFTRNQVSRGGAEGVQAAVTVSGVCHFLGNQISGFDGPGSSGLLLQPDRFEKAPASVYRDNHISDCTTAVGEAKAGLWQAATRAGNVFRGCGKTPEDRRP